MAITMMNNMINPEVMGDMINAKIEALAKMEAIQRVIDMPLLWEQDDRRRYARVVNIVKRDLLQEVEK